MNSKLFRDELDPGKIIESEAEESENNRVAWASNVCYKQFLGTEEN